MANYFDRYDEPDQNVPRITVRPQTNYFDKYDAPSPSRSDGNSVGAVEDTARSVWSGVNAGVAGLVGLPDTLASLGAAGIDKASEAVAGLFGVDYQRPQVQDSPAKGVLPTTKGTKDVLNTYVPGAGYKPQTIYGEYGHTVGEFLPGAIAAPGGVVGNAIRYGVLPGLASEGAGQVTKGTSLEQPARIGAAIATGGIAGAMARPGTSAQAIRNQLPEGITPQMVDQAQNLITEAAQRGITLSWPEALSQTAGRPVLSNLARHLEAAPATEARMAEFYGPRAGQVEAAGRQAMDGIAPPNYAPSTIGPAAGVAAEETAQGVRQAVNRAAEPFYTASERVTLDPATMARVRALPGYDAARAAVQNDPQLARYVAGLPENSVGFLNEVKKQLDYQGRNAAAPMGPQGIPNQQRVAGFTRDAEATRQAGINATGGPAGSYATALRIEEEGRRRFLDPLLQGPLGKIAGRDTPTKNAIDALFPRNPLPNSEHEIATAVGALAQRSPRIAADLVRAHTESVFNEATRALQGGANQAGGAKFRVQLVGNPQQRANFEAAVTALPNGADRLAGFNRFLDVLEATGTRQNIGSKTAYNAEFLKQQASSGIVGEVAKGAANPITRLTQGLIEKYERYRLGRNLNELADILTNPAAVGQLRAIARMPANSSRAEVTAFRLLNLTRSAGSSGAPIQ
jgi:hypothetical protein